jgi:23S rRNA (adenine2503-C2)-methyltransferase
MTTLPKDLRSELMAAFRFPSIELEELRRSEDGTEKILWRLVDGEAVESVMIPSGERDTFCVSSQAGCALACAFCATGMFGFRRNLTTGEIVDQVRRLQKRREDVGHGANVVFMGMGEPLANYRHVLSALELLLSDYAYGLSRRRVTISTSGLVPNIERLGDDCNVSLAVSLHASNDALRDRLMPINKVHRIEALLDACWRYAAKRSNRFITFEYVMLRDVNDSLQHADELFRLLHGRPAKVNLIPFNPFEGNDFRRSERGRIAEFQNRLRQKGLVVTTRKTRGEDIDAACGQLAGKVSDRMRVRLGEKSIGVATA